jgi:hypothetical protein
MDIKHPDLDSDSDSQLAEQRAKERRIRREAAKAKIAATQQKSETVGQDKDDKIPDWVMTAAPDVLERIASSDNPDALKAVSMAKNASIGLLNKIISQSPELAVDIARRDDLPPEVADTIIYLDASAHEDAHMMLLRRKDLSDDQIVSLLRQWPGKYEDLVVRRGAPMSKDLLEQLVEQANEDTLRALLDSQPRERIPDTVQAMINQRLMESSDESTLQNTLLDETTPLETIHAILSQHPEMSLIVAERNNISPEILDELISLEGDFADKLHEKLLLRTDIPSQDIFRIYLLNQDRYGETLIPRLPELDGNTLAGIAQGANQKVVEYMIFALEDHTIPWDDEIYDIVYGRYVYGDEDMSDYLERMHTEEDYIRYNQEVERAKLEAQQAQRPDQE